MAKESGSRARLAGSVLALLLLTVTLASAGSALAAPATYRRPAVRTVEPNSGPAAGGTAITITGRNFIGTTQVRIGLEAAEFTVVDNTTITAVTPPNVFGAGTVDIIISSPGGPSRASRAAQFTYTP